MSMQKSSCNMSICISTTKARTKRCPQSSRTSFLGLFTKKSLVQCRCAFRLWKLAQNRCPAPGPQHYSYNFVPKKNEMCPCAFRVCKVAHNENSRTDILAANKNRELLQTSFTSISNMIDLYFCLSFLIPGDQVSVCAWFSLSVANLASGTPSSLRESSTHRVGGKYYCRNAVVVYLSIFSPCLWCPTVKHYCYFTSHDMSPCFSLRTNLFGYGFCEGHGR